jgi:hypothetical protein
MRIYNMAARSKVWFCGRSLAGIVGLNSTLAWMLGVSVVCCQAEVSVSGRSLVQRSPTDLGVSECNREASYGKAMTRNPFEAPQKRHGGVGI